MSQRRQEMHPVCAVDAAAKMGEWRQLTDKKTGRVYVVMEGETMWLWDMLADPGGNRYFYNNVEKRAVWYVERPELERIANPKIKPDQWPKIREREATARDQSTVRDHNATSKRRAVTAASSAETTSTKKVLVELTPGIDGLGPNEIRGVSSSGRPYAFNSVTKVSRWLPVSTNASKPELSKPVERQEQQSTNKAAQIRPVDQRHSNDPFPRVSSSKRTAPWNEEYPSRANKKVAPNTQQSDDQLRNRRPAFSSKGSEYFTDRGPSGESPKYNGYLTNSQRQSLAMNSLRNNTGTDIRDELFPSQSFTNGKARSLKLTRSATKIPLKQPKRGQPNPRHEWNTEVEEARQTVTMGYPVVHNKADWKPSRSKNVVAESEFLVSKFVQNLGHTNSYFASQPHCVVKIIMSARGIDLSNYRSQALSIDVDLPDEEAEVTKNRPVVGTSKSLEKRYLRLTSAAKPEEVRSKEVLKEAFKRLKSQWNAHNIDYPYMLDQLKSIRQDLTVQGVRDSFTVRVYETQARLALESRDVGEFNASLTQLTALYDKSGLHSSSFEEFTAYRVLYALYNGGKEGVTQTYQSLDSSIRSTRLVSYAVNLCLASLRCDYVKFMGLYRDAPAMQGYLVDWFVDRERSRALQRIVKAYKGQESLEISFLYQNFKKRVGDAQEESLNEFTVFLGSVGAKIIGSGIACKESNIEVATIARPAAMA